MPVSGNVFITISDGQGSVAAVPANSVQAVIGCSSSGTAFAIVATPNPAVLPANLGGGPLPEAGGLTCSQGGTVLACKVPSNTPGAQSTVTKTGLSSSTMTVSGNAYDDYDVKVKVMTAGTIGAGGVIAVSLDAGRTYGPNIALPLASPATYVIASTGMTLSFAAGTLIAGDTYTFGATGPIWAASDVQTALNTLAASQYGTIGWGSTHIVGNGGGAQTLTGGVPGADAQTLEGYLDALAVNYQFTRSFLSARDASPPSLYGGSGESEVTWVNSVVADYSAVSAKRLCVGAANWNMPSPFTNPSAGTPRYRRNIAWAAAAKQVTIPPQRHNGRVSDGSLPTVVVDPTNDPNDGFVYHNESNVAGLDYLFSGTGGRFMTTTLRKGRPGVFITNPLLMSPLGSQFSLMPYGTVMDVACDVVYQTGSQFINDDIRLNANGTIFENDAKFLEAAFTNAINSNMLAAGMISPGTVVTVDRTNNVQSTGQVKVTIVIVARGYILSESITIGYSNPAAAA
jgi:hypothetical protein